jgi:hypothetical protein
MKSDLPLLPQAFSINYEGLSNRIISDVELFEFFDPRKQPLDARPPAYKTTALWDTGATASIITRSTALALKLTPTGTIRVNHGGGQSDHPTHVVNIGLPNRFLITGVIVTEMEHIVDNFGAIIGMDIIAMGDFALTNLNRKTCVSFRVPSLTKIDFVEEWEKKTKGLRGHDKCPCGSGQPVRKCHRRRA